MLWMAGCASVGDIGSAVGTIGQQAGVFTEEEAQSIIKTSEAVGKSFTDITPVQEYYIGRSVGAEVLQKYKPFDADEATRYVNLVGQTLAMASAKPETFGGYHFLVLDAADINAFAAPGGLIFVTRGMLKLCRSEDELAAVLAHEIGHVELMHGLRAIQQSRLTSALTILAAESAKNFGSEDLAQVTRDFEGSIGDVTQTMMTSGYARGLERQADQAAVRILRAVGYNPSALVRMLQEMNRRLKPGGLDFAKTHPDPAIRIRDVQGLVGQKAGSSAGNAASQARFQRAMRGV